MFYSPTTSRVYGDIGNRSYYRHTLVGNRWWVMSAMRSAFLMASYSTGLGNVLEKWVDEQAPAEGVPIDPRVEYVLRGKAEMYDSPKATRSTQRARHFKSSDVRSVRPSEVFAA